MAFLWQSLGENDMAFGKDTQVSMMMGFPAVVDKIQETDRLRGFENTYVTITEVKKVCFDGLEITLEDGETLIVSNEQMVLTAMGWKHAIDIRKDDWLCGKEEDEYIVVKNITSVKQQDMVVISVLESGSIVANGVTLGIYA